MPAFVKLGDLKADTANNFVVQPESLILPTDGDDILTGYPGASTHELQLGTGSGHACIMNMDTKDRNTHIETSGRQTADFWTTEMISTFKSDALTNYHPEGFSEVEIHFIAQSDSLTSYHPEGFSEVEIHFIAQIQEACANGSFLTEGIQSYSEIEPDIFGITENAGTVFESIAGMDSFGESLNSAFEIGGISGPGATSFMTGNI